ncbi:MAG: hypothetical protein D6812_13345 [Deltaproteobacteria bacterium]|nr:MAG: hypothetical protein D6812_13345 [Deltaproteobacteria bacterium]
MRNPTRNDSTPTVTITATATSRDRLPAWLPEVSLLLEIWRRTGLLGRKRGEFVRRRCVVQQRHTQERLGRWAAAGNGEIWTSRKACCQRIAASIEAGGLRPDQALIRMASLASVPCRTGAVR